ncbi:MAG TPA: hypothetical protein VKR38_00775 [Usitatibacter sp.]|nr:hypothetical protein [Usitatibacter sp.]
MNRTTQTAIAAAVSLVFSAAAMAGSMSKSDYNVAKDNIHADYKSGKAACDALQANAKDICLAEAKGKESVAMADLTVVYKPTTKSRYDARIAKADAEYSVAKEKCDDQSGNAKDVCVKEAEAAHVTARADAKAHMKTVEAKETAHEKTVDARVDANKQIADAQKTAASDKRDADYAVAKQKCDAQAGDAKDRCVVEAKALYGKS